MAISKSTSERLTTKGSEIWIQTSPDNNNAAGQCTLENNDIFINPK